MAKVDPVLKLSVVLMAVGALWRWYDHSSRLPPVFEGEYKPHFTPVADLFRRMLEDGRERGGSLAVYRAGEVLVEVRGGYADPGSRRAWREDTVTQVWSATKGVTAITVAKLVEKGHIDYKNQVREYWPEFAQNGKANVTVEMLLSHQAGLATMGGQTVSLQDYRANWTKVERVLASAVPDHPPGTRVGYHAISFAMYVDALVRRADPQHRNLSQVFREEIAVPYGIDFFLGLPREQTWRTARGHFIKPWEFLSLLADPDHAVLFLDMLTNKDNLFARATQVISDYDIYQMERSNDPTLMDVGIGSSIGFSAAGPLAKLYDYIGNGGQIGTKRLLPKNIVDSFFKPLSEHLPSVHTGLATLPFSTGLLSLPFRDYRRAGHSGYGGQQTFADPKEKLGIAYVTNFHSPRLITPSENYLALERALYECLDREKEEKNVKVATDESHDVLP